MATRDDKAPGGQRHDNPHAVATRAAVDAMVRANLAGDARGAERHRRRAQRALDRHLHEYRRRLS